MQIVGGGTLKIRKIFISSLGSLILASFLLWGLRGFNSISKEIVNLGSSDNEVVRQAYVRLGEGGTRVSRALIRGMENPDPSIRKHSAVLLGLNHDSGGKEALISHLNDPSPAVVAACVKALGRISIRGNVDEALAFVAEESHPMPQRAAVIKAVSESPSPDLSRYSADFALDRRRPVPLRIAAAEGLAQHDSMPESERLLRAGLERSDNPEVRKSLIEAIGRHSVRKFVSVLLKTLNDPREDLPVREACLHVLAMWREKKAVPSIVAILRDPKMRVLHNCAASELAYIGGAQASKAVKEALDSNEFDVRSDAATGFLIIKDPAAIPILKKRLAIEKDDRVRRALTYAIKELEKY